MITRKLPLWLRALHPTYWLLNHPISLALDKELSMLIDQGAPLVLKSEHRASIGHLSFWIANRPYAAFETYGYMPSRKTLIRALDLLEDTLFKKEGI